MERISVWMIRENIDSFPEHKLPQGYRFRTFQDGDRQTWCEICVEAGLFDSLEKAQETFEKDFGGHEDELKTRCFFVVEESTGKAVGTTTAWYDVNFQNSGLDYGRIHWVAIRKDYQGRKLAKPMLTHAMRYLSEHYDRARLGTNTDCARAISIYLDFGFEPDLRTERWQEAWCFLAEETGHPKLKGFRTSG